jgi:hypothetical protein
MSWLQRLETAALRWHSHGVAAMILLVLLAQQGTAQQADDKVIVLALYYSNNLQWKVKVNLPLYLIDYALHYEDVWTSVCIDLRFLDLNTSWS